MFSNLTSLRRLDLLGHSLSFRRFSLKGQPESLAAGDQMDGSLDFPGPKKSDHKVQPRLARKGNGFFPTRATDGSKLLSAKLRISVDFPCSFSFPPSLPHEYCSRGCLFKKRLSGVGAAPTKEARPWEKTTTTYLLYAENLTLFRHKFRTISITIIYRWMLSESSGEQADL